MSYRKAPITWRAKQVAKMVNNKKIVFDNVVQRSYVWDAARKSLLISSMIIDCPIEPMYGKRRPDKVIDMLEGQQRLVTITKYLNNEFKLSHLEPFDLVDDITGEKKRYDINGKKFSELPEELQEILNTFSITIYYFDDITQEEAVEMFKRLNNGKPLSTKERNIAYCNDIMSIMDLGKHRLFKDMLTPRAYEAKSYVPIIAKIYQMYTEEIENISFMASIFNQYIQKIEISSEETKQLLNLFDDMEFVHDTIVGDGDKLSKKIGKKIYKELHLVSLVPFFKRAEENKIDMSLMADWIREFYGPEDTLSVSDDYNIASLAGTAKPENIQKRYQALEESFNEFFKESEEE